MGWKIVEKSVLPKDPVQGSEDAIFESEWCIAVLDGHKNCCVEPIDGKTGGQHAVYAGIDVLAAMPHDIGPDELVPALSRGVEPKLARFAEDPRDRPGFVFEALLMRHDVIVRVGDCQFLLDGRGENEGHAVDHLNARLRALKLKRLLSEGVSKEQLCADDPTRPFIHRRITTWQRQFRNSSDIRYGFGVINGADVPLAYREQFVLDGGEHEIIFSSDGYPVSVLDTSLEATERGLQQILSEDPLCIEKWPSVRGLVSGAERTDDCTYLRLVRT